MALFRFAFVVLVSLFTLLEGVSIVRDDVDTIVLDESDWNICPSEAPIAGRDFRLTKAQGCFTGQDITGITDPRVIVVFESQNVSVDCLITVNLVYNSFDMNWIAASSFPRYGHVLMVSLNTYTRGKLYAVGDGASCWTLIKVFGYDVMRPTALPFTTLTPTSTTLGSKSRPVTQNLTTKNPFTKLLSTRTRLSTATERISTTLGVSSMGMRSSTTQRSPLTSSTRSSPTSATIRRISTTAVRRISTTMGVSSTKSSTTQGGSLKTSTRNSTPTMTKRVLTTSVVFSTKGSTTQKSSLVTLTRTFSTSATYSTPPSTTNKGLVHSSTKTKYVIIGCLCVGVLLFIVCLYWCCRWCKFHNCFRMKVGYQCHDDVENLNDSRNQHGTAGRENPDFQDDSPVLGYQVVRDHSSESSQQSTDRSSNVRTPSGVEIDHLEGGTCIEMNELDQGHVADMDWDNFFDVDLD